MNTSAIRKYLMFTQERASDAREGLLELLAVEERLFDLEPVRGVDDGDDEHREDDDRADHGDRDTARRPRAGRDVEPPRILRRRLPASSRT